MSIDEILASVECICKKNKVEQLYLFGSYAKGNQTKTSDIDIIVKGCEDIGSLREQINCIPTLKKIDIFDYDSIRNPYLKEEMDTYGKQIY